MNVGHLPSQNDLAHQLLGAEFVEGPLTWLMVHFVHQIQHGVRTQDLVADISHQQRACLILQDGRDEARPHLQLVLLDGYTLVWGKIVPSNWFHLQHSQHTAEDYVVHLQRRW